MRRPALPVRARGVHEAQRVPRPPHPLEQLGNALEPSKHASRHFHCFSNRPSVAKSFSSASHFEWS